jgi:hypothetical protein
MRARPTIGHALPLPAGLTWMHLVDPDARVAAGA